MDTKISCPNCGEGLDAPHNNSAFICPQCGELLMLTSMHKLVLAHPIKTYLELDEKSRLPDTEYLDSMPTSGRIPLSDRRKKRSAQLASERINQQKKIEHRGFVSGFILSILGGLFLLSIWTRVVLFGHDWLGITGAMFGLGLLFMGLAVTLWFLYLMRTADKQ